jgi:hypothetical protein
MKYKCVLVRQDETWLTIGKIYEGDISIDFPGYIEIAWADDKFPAFAPSNQFIAYRETDSLGV